MNTADFLLSAGNAGSVAVVEESATYHYRDLRRAVAQISAALTEVTAPGDRVGLLAPNSFFWIASYLAILHTGRVVAPFAVTATSAEIARQADWVDARVMLVDPTSARRHATALAGRTALTPPLVPSPHEATTLGPGAEVDPGDDAVVAFTSGTTAAPKAVRVTHANLQANTTSILSYLDLHEHDRMLVLLPFPYCFGASLLHTHLRVGASVALCDTLTFPETVIEAIARHEATGLAGVPSTYQLLLRASTLATTAIPHLRYLQQAGGRLAPALVDELRRAQPQARVLVMYGQTEATARLSYLDPRDLDTHPGSIGRGLPDAPLRVVDEHDRDVAPGVIGEVVASGPHITKGYWNDPEATAAKYRGGLLRTGDLGSVDEEGYIYLTDRISDFLKPYGIRVSSQEIEEAALAVPGVISAGATSIPHESAGEVVVLFVVVGKQGPDGEAVRQALRRTLARHMVPHAVHVVDRLPLNAHGKPVKSQLRQLAIRAAHESSPQARVQERETS